MKEQELRIGNWVKIDDLPEEQITLDTFSTLKQFPHTISVFNGIKLTEEWLIKFGFQKEEVGSSPLDIWNEWNIKDFVISSTGTEEGVRDEFIIVVKPRKVIKLPYVHTLQNLYFVIEQKELEKI